MQGKGEIRKYVGKLPHVAVVEVMCEEADSIEIVDRCEGEGWVRQGWIEEAGSKGYDDWKRAAEVGVRFGLKVCGSHALVTIDCISGMRTDTNATAVAIAAARAVWDGVGYMPSEGMQQEMEASLIGAWELDPKVASYFEALEGG